MSEALKVGETGELELFGQTEVRIAKRLAGSFHRPVEVIEESVGDLESVGHRGRFGLVSMPSRCDSLRPFEPLPQMLAGRMSDHRVGFEANLVPATRNSLTPFSVASRE